MVDWYDTGWNYRKSHTITGATGAGQNYQIPIYVHYGSGNDSGSDVYLSSQCKSDFSDIRFTGSDGTTLLDYWIETKTDMDTAKVWVEVKEDLGSNRTIYLYYGNNDAASESNGANTFPFFDDFDGGSIDSAKWDIQYWANPNYGSGTASYSVSNSKLVLTAPAGSYRQIQVNAKTAYGNSAMHSRVYPHPLAAYNIVTAWGRIQNEPTVYNQRSMGQLNGVGLSWIVDDYDHHRYARWGSSNQVTDVNIAASWRTYWEKLVKNSRVEEGYDSTSENTFTTNIPNSDLRPAFLCGCTDGYAYQQNYLEVDWVFLREYVYPEPQNSSWGTIEGVAIIVAKDGRLSGSGSKQTVVQGSASVIIKVEPNVPTSEWEKTAIIENLVIEGNGNNTGILLENVYNCLIRNVTIKNCAEGIRLTATDNNFSEANRIEHVRMINVNKGVVFDKSNGTGSFAFTTIDDVGISLTDANSSVGIEIGSGDTYDNCKPYSSIIRANVWMGPNYPGTGLNILSNYPSNAAQHGEIKGGLGCLTVINLGASADGTGVDLHFGTGGVIANNQTDFLLVGHNLGNTVKNDVGGNRIRAVTF
jgi:parallel beta-helix repeat protein